MSRMLRTEDWIVLPGKSLARIEALAVRIRHDGNQRKVRGELRICKSNLLRKLDKMGYARTRKRSWSLTEAHLSLAFARHSKAIADELNISEKCVAPVDQQPRPLFRQRNRPWTPLACPR